MKAGTDERVLDQLTCAIEAHGYRVLVQPIAGGECAYVAALRDAVAKIDATMAMIHSAEHGARGMSKRAIALLHSYLPQPIWGVEMATYRTLSEVAADKSWSF